MQWLKWLVSSSIVGLCATPPACAGSPDRNTRAAATGGSGGEAWTEIGTAGRGGSGAGLTAGTTALDPVSEYCLAQCETRLRCASLNLAEESVQKCTADCTIPYGRPTAYRADVFAALQSCVQAIDCGRSIDECNLNGANVVSNDPENHPVVATCLAKYDACNDAAAPFSDDICLLGIFLVESAYPDFQACMAKACGDVPTCFNAIRGR